MWIDTWRGYSHVAPGCDAALVDVAGQADQLAVVVVQAIWTEGFINALTAQRDGRALVESQQAQQKDAKQLDTKEPRLCYCVLSSHLDVYFSLC